MRLVQEEIARLESLHVEGNPQSDFVAFWQKAVARVNEAEPGLEATDVDYVASGIAVRDIRFRGLDGTPVAGWYLRPTGVDGPLPVMVVFHGGNWRRGRPLDFAPWLMAGFAVVSMDFRQQGGRTGSNTPMDMFGVNHWITMNIEDHENYYLYHAWTDALMGLRVARNMPEVDADRTVVFGGSQGGGAALVMASLDPDVTLCVANVPSFCWWEKRVQTRTACANVIADYICRHPDQMETVFRTLSYFDVINFVDRITCPVLCSCGLEDACTPPECVYAAYNNIRAEKEMINSPFTGHAVPSWVLEREMAWVLGKL
jgi:cephalosporin-C deacetylase